MTSRVYLFDNIKVYLMLLVIVAHTLIASYGCNDTVVSFIWFVCLSYTMPLFTFISGFFSKSEWNFRKNVNSLLIPFLFFNVVNVCVENWVNPNFYFTWKIPGFAMWYLLVLFLYRLLLPLCEKHIWHTIIISLILSWIVGYIPAINTVFSLSRFFCFMPFFLSGYIFSRYKLLDKLMKVNMGGVKMAFLLICILWLIVLSFKPHLVFATSFTRGYGTGCVQLLFRLFVQVSVFIMSLCVLRLFPNREMWYTKYGRNTVNVYLLHGLIILPFAYVVFPRFEEGCIAQKIVMILLPTFCCIPLFSFWIKDKMNFLYKLI